MEQEIRQIDNSDAIKKRGSYKKRPSPEEIADTYYRNAGNLTQTAKALGYTRETLYQWRNKNEKLDRLLREREEALIDDVESLAFRKMKEGDTTMLIFFLKTKGKDRGYTERREVDMKASVVTAVSRLEAKDIIAKLEAE